MTTPAARPRVLIARRLFPEVIDRLRAHFDVDYREADESGAGHRANDVVAVIGLGGTQGTSSATGVMRQLPYGFPKLMVSTCAAGGSVPSAAARLARATSPAYT